MPGSEAVGINGQQVERGQSRHTGFPAATKRDSPPPSVLCQTCPSLSSRYVSSTL